MLTVAPELRPYSALKVELSALNSCTVFIEGWNVIWFWTMSLRLTPLIMKFTVSSRLPAVLMANEPWPRSGAVRNPFWGGVTEPGMSRPRSTKCRPLGGISWTGGWLVRVLGGGFGGLEWPRNRGLGLEAPAAHLDGINSGR